MIDPVEVMARAMLESDGVEGYKVETLDAYKIAARAAITAASEAGWVLVPKIPTGQMLEAGNANIKYQIEEDPERSGTPAWPYASTIYAAMIAAASEEAARAEPKDIAKANQE